MEQKNRYRWSVVKRTEKKTEGQVSHKANNTAQPNIWKDFVCQPLVSKDLFAADSSTQTDGLHKGESVFKTLGPRVFFWLVVPRTNCVVMAKVTGPVFFRR